MIAALYLNLREELQQDAARVEHQLEELRQAESFLLRRINLAQNRSSYQAVLNDLSEEITKAEEEHAELLRLSRFVTRALLNSYAQEPVLGTLPLKSSTTKSEQPKNHEPLETASSAPPNTAAKRNDKSEEPKPSVAKNAILEFDAAGFPILESAKKSSSAKLASQPKQEDGPLPEPPTVVFDQNGFPLNPPTADRQERFEESPPIRFDANGLPINTSSKDASETLIEPPKSKPADTGFSKRAK